MRCTAAQIQYVHGDLTMKSTKGQDQNFIVDTIQDREPMKTFQNRSNTSPPVCTGQKSRS